MKRVLPARRTEREPERFERGRTHFGAADEGTRRGVRVDVFKDELIEELRLMRVIDANAEAKQIERQGPESLDAAPLPVPRERHPVVNGVGRVGQRVGRRGSIVTLDRPRECLTQHVAGGEARFGGQCLGVFAVPYERERGVGAPPRVYGFIGRGVHARTIRPGHGENHVAIVNGVGRLDAERGNRGVEGSRGFGQPGVSLCGESAILPRHGEAPPEERRCVEVHRVEHRDRFVVRRHGSVEVLGATEPRERIGPVHPARGETVAEHRIAIERQGAPNLDGALEEGDGLGPRRSRSRLETGNPALHEDRRLPIERRRTSSGVGVANRSFVGHAFRINVRGIGALMEGACRSVFMSSISRLVRPWIWTACGALAAAVALPASSVRAADQALASQWRTKDIHVDGENTEWGPLAVIEDGPAVGVENDADALYVIATTSDQTLRQTLAQGLIVWLDATDHKKKTFGIGIPGVVEPGGAGPRRLAPPTEGVLLPEPATSITQFDVYGPGKKERHLVRLDPSLGVELAAIEDRGVLTYELKVPLAKDGSRLYAVGAAPGATIGIGLESVASPAPRGRMGGGRGGRPMGPLGGRIGGIGTGGFNGGQFSEGRQEPLKYWASLRLARAAQ